MHQPCFKPTSLVELFPDEDYRLQMRFTRGDPAAYFAPSENHAATVAERAHWLETAPKAYYALLTAGEPLMEECARLAADWTGFSSNGRSSFDVCLALGKFWETDFLLLNARDAGEIRLLGGCVCFPSHWRLTDKINRPIEFIHSSVPGLNDSLGASIHKFLASLKPGIAWQRVNWGLSRSAELNQHPDRKLPRLDGTVGLEEVTLRVEEQALVALPASNGILFGIRLVNHSLTDVNADRALASRFCRTLETMPEAMARYKGLSDARPRLLELLRA